MSANSTLATIDQFLQTVGQTAKSASTAHTEPGSIGGETSHPVKNVDDRTSPASEGERSTENTKDVKDNNGEASVDSTPEAKAAALRKRSGNEGSAADDQLQIGTNKQPTGEDPENETSSAKPGKDDGGYEGPSSHPARTDNDSLDGHKYAKDLSKMSLSEKAAALAALGNEICADITVASHTPAPAAPKQASTPKAAAETCTDDEEEAMKMASEWAGQIGWEMAGILSGTLDKQAAEAMVQNALVEIVKAAELDADNVAAFIAELNKQAGEEETGADPAADSGSSAPAGDAGPASAPAPGPEAGSAGPAGGGEDALAQLAAVCEELGISPEELLTVLSGAAGGEGGAGGAEAGLGGPAGPGAGAGAPPMGDPAAAMGGGQPMPPLPPEAAGGMEVSANAKNVKPTSDKVASYIREVVNRARKTTK